LAPCTFNLLYLNNEMYYSKHTSMSRSFGKSLISNKLRFRDCTGIATFSARVADKIITFRGVRLPSDLRIRKSCYRCLFIILTIKNLWHFTPAARWWKKRPFNAFKVWLLYLKKWAPSEVFYFFTCTPRFNVQCSNVRSFTRSFPVGLY